MLMPFPFSTSVLSYTASGTFLIRVCLTRYGAPPRPRHCRRITRLRGGFLTACSYRDLTYALPLSLLTFFIVKVLPRLEIDFHFLTVVVMSLLLWAAGASVLLSFFSYVGGSCVLDFADGGDDATISSEGDARPSRTFEPPPEILNYSCGGADVDPSAINSIWAGVVDGKALTKPRPRRPPLAKPALAGGTVAVWVLVGESGRVLRSQVVSGHPLLKQPAAEAACSARFSPLVTSSSPVVVSGILTYIFAP